MAVKRVDVLSIEQDTVGVFENLATVRVYTFRWFRQAKSETVKYACRQGASWRNCETGELAPHYVWESLEKYRFLSLWGRRRVAGRSMEAIR